jgi:hypothetical protein
LRTLQAVLEERLSIVLKVAEEKVAQMRPS